MTTLAEPKVKQNKITVEKTGSSTRLAGLAALGGALIMIIGAVLYFSSGTDLWAAVDGGDMAGYLEAVGGVKAQLVANLTFWIVGVLVLGTAVNAMANLCVQRQTLAQVARVLAGAAVPLAIVAFIAMLSIVVQIAPDRSPVSVAMANVIGWIGIRSDDLATALIIGFAPMAIALAAKDEWLPGWLTWWGYLAGLVGLLSVVVLYIPGMGQFGFLMVPVGMGWMIAVGLVLLRRK